jgi:hypothetical protein
MTHFSRELNSLLQPSIYEDYQGIEMQLIQSVLPQMLQMNIKTITHFTVKHQLVSCFQKEYDGHIVQLKENMLQVKFPTTHNSATSIMKHMLHRLRHELHYEYPEFINQTVQKMLTIISASYFMLNYSQVSETSKSGIIQGFVKVFEHCADISDWDVSLLPIAIRNGAGCQRPVYYQVTILSMLGFVLGELFFQELCHYKPPAPETTTETTTSNNDDLRSFDTISSHYHIDSFKESRSQYLERKDMGLSMEEYIAFQNRSPSKIMSMLDYIDENRLAKGIALLDAKMEALYTEPKEVKAHDISNETLSELDKIRSQKVAEQRKREEEQRRNKASKNAASKKLEKNHRKK